MIEINKITQPSSEKWVKILLPYQMHYDGTISAYRIMYVKKNVLSDFSDYKILAECNKLEDFKF